MRITGIDARSLRLPASRTPSLSVAGRAPVSECTVLVAQVKTDEGISGLGFGCCSAGGRSLLAIIEDELTPLLVGEDPLNNERLWAKVQMLDHAGVRPAYAGLDIALWDLKGKAARLPLWRLLGGARERVKAFTAETADAALSAEALIAMARSAKAQGMMGIRIAVAGMDPEAESQKIVNIRDALGEQIWFAVSVEKSFDYETALPFARFIEEEIGADWFENPLPDNDLVSYSRLS
jgi:L-alanine-DL-glutamate epimerase-like enolase superfamily enzyme